MSKLVILRLGPGSFEQGFPVTLQIGAEHARPTIEMPGTLPPVPGLLQAYGKWQAIYQQLDWSGRPIGLPKQPATTVAQCQVAAGQLRDCFNQWLQAESMRQIREKWLEKLQPADTVRIMLQTDDDGVQKLPWHLWDLVERYPHAEIALSAPVYEPPPRSQSKTQQVRILAVLGNSTGINTQVDRDLLAQLPQAQVTFLVEPQRATLTAHLWQQPWDIFFFAGHSASQPGGGHGYIAINPTEKLTLGELKYGLRQAVAQGLKLAMFNSCDGLGLAHEFAELQIPQLIVMREPVPDRVAQCFLQYFLAAFAQNQPLYLAVRSAREQLQALEAQFPCATWLPVIFQNPAEVPPTWQALLGRTAPALWQPLTKRQRGLVALLGLAIAAATMAVRHTGLVQPLELAIYDYMLRLRPQEPPDARLLVITVTEADVQAQPQRRGSLADGSLAKLLTKLERAQPRAIGLDIYRDFAVERAVPQLAAQLRSDRLITVCRVASEVSQSPEIAPPPEIAVEQLGFSNFVVDADRVLRRQLLALQPPTNAKCAADYAFSTMLALRYLAAENIALEFAPDGSWRLGQQVLTPLRSHQGGYQGIDAWGHQILLNYRNYRSPAAVAPQITLAQALDPKWNAAIVKNRIVLIGTTAESFQDVSLTPYQLPTGERLLIPGVMMQAQMVSQVVSAVLDRRPLITTWSAVGDLAWVLVWGMTGATIGSLRRPIYVGLTVLGAIIIVIGGSFVGLVAAIWVPVLPPILALVTASVAALRSSIILLSSPRN